MEKALSTILRLYLMPRIWCLWHIRRLKSRDQASNSMRDRSVPRSWAPKKEIHQRLKTEWRLWRESQKQWFLQSNLNSSTSISRQTMMKIYVRIRLTQPGMQLTQHPAIPAHHSISSNRNHSCLGETCADSIYLRKLRSSLKINRESSSHSHPMSIAAAKSALKQPIKTHLRVVVNFLALLIIWVVVPVEYTSFPFNEDYHRVQILKVAVEATMLIQQPPRAPWIWDIMEEVTPLSLQIVSQVPNFSDYPPGERTMGPNVRAHLPQNR